jgi:Tol biopolymer transport system component
MKTISKFILLFVNLTAAILLSGCGGSSGWPTSIPDRDILFQSEQQTLYELNFIDSDGSNHQILKVPQNFIKPIWSLDGQIIYGLSSPNGQFPYEDMGYPAYWNITSRTFKLCSDNLPYYSQIQSAGNPDRPNEVILYNVSEIVTLDLDTCQQTKILVDFNHRTGEFAISGFSYNLEAQELVYGRYTVPFPPSREYRLIKLDLQTNEQVELAKGVNPAWSPDGALIAYVGVDGLYVIAEDGSQSRQIIQAVFFDPSSITSPDENAPLLSWSPDGEWITYHQCFDAMCSVDKTPINKINVTNGQQVKIFTGGKYPTWRP